MHRHSLEYLALQLKQVDIAAKREKTQRLRAGSAADAEVRRVCAGAAPLPQQASLEVAAADEPSQIVLSSAACTALWSTGAVRGARAASRRVSEPVIRAVAGLADPEALTAALKTYAPPPRYEDRKFDAWIRMRFGRTPS